MSGTRYQKNVDQIFFKNAFANVDLRDTVGTQDQIYKVVSCIKKQIGT